METNVHAIAWAEIPVENFDRAKQFYSKIYDFEMPDMQMGSNRMGFLMSDQEKGIGAAIVDGDGYVPSKQGTKLYLSAGDDLSIVLNRVESAGGKILTSKTMITPEYGYYAAFEDSEGNLISLHSMN